MTKKIQSIPEARLLLESLRSVGYNEETAIADIIDNCISAKAHEIKIQFDWEKKRIVISDDGLGMWIHPELNRAISIREAARLQTFPDSFIFCGSKDKQYQQVGNAVPPIMAKAIAEKLADQLEQIEKRYER